MGPEDSLAEARPRTELLALTRFESPLPAAWQAEQIARLTASEQAHLARIERPLRREQFVVGHSMLRSMLTTAELGDVAIEVDTNGRPQLARGAAHASIAHSANAVAVIIAREPVGVDLEEIRALQDPVAAAALMSVPPKGETGSAGVLRAWVTFEARLKAGPGAQANAWCSKWDGCHLAVAGLATPPLTGVFDLLTGTYNSAELQWEAVVQQRSS